MNTATIRHVLQGIRQIGPSDNVASFLSCLAAVFRLCGYPNIRAAVQQIKRRADSVRQSESGSHWSLQDCRKTVLRHHWAPLGGSAVTSFERYPRPADPNGDGAQIQKSDEAHTCEVTVFPYLRSRLRLRSVSRPYAKTTWDRRPSLCSRDAYVAIVGKIFRIASGNSLAPAPVPSSPTPLGAPAGSGRLFWLL